MIQRGLIILIAGEALFIIGIILAIVWGIQLASTFASAFQQERATLINRVSIEPGSSVEAATTQVTDISNNITVAIHIQRLGEREEAGEGDDGLGQRLQEQLQEQLQLPREQREARLIETVIDPSGTVVSNNEFSANLFTTFQPQNTGEYILNITNAGARNVTIYGIFGHMPVLTAASTFAEGGGQPPLFDVDLSSFSLVIAGGILTAIGFIIIIAGTIIVVIDSRKRGEQKSGSSSDSVGEGGIAYRKD
ncbi:MAG TPA: hypothetical protein VFR94_25675 [Nitrososphaeraceae archaeon]|nr:hypothetical protein [Nitrososphaeraceae archaeon]